MPSEDSDPIEDFQLTLEVARAQADKHDFVSAYYTLAAAYEVLIGEHEALIDEIIQLRKKLRSV
jgi:hypothetical protein